MIHAYSELYLSKAQKALAGMMRYAVTDLGYDPDSFFDLFIETGLAYRFGTGESRLTVGMSGVELAREVVYLKTGKEVETEPTYSLEKDDVYWAGWALAYYQWYSGHTFVDIIRYIKFSDIMRMYSPYHEMDISHFVEAMDRIIPPVTLPTRLAVYREKCGLSQKELADSSGVSVRMIQTYEQRRKDINKAQAYTVWKLSSVLGCSMQELLEFPRQTFLS